MHPVRALNTSSSVACLSFQQTSDNAENVEEIERRVQSLAGVLASPISEDDHAEKWRRAELLRFVPGWVYIGLFIRFAHPSHRKLEGVVAKLEPLSKQHAFVRFLHNIDNAKMLTGFIQELANAITDYQVWAVSPSMNFDEHQTRFRYNKECMKGQGKSMMIPRTSW